MKKTLLALILAVIFVLIFTLCVSAAEENESTTDTEGEIILGDVNGDGIITNADVLKIYRYIYNSSLYPLDIALADVNLDGMVTNADVLKIYRYIYNPQLYPLQTVCQHSFGEWRVVDKADCLNDGVKTRSCSKCGETETESYFLPTYTATEIYNQAIQYTGEILVYDKMGIKLSTGTGFVYSSDGLIITNYHVIEDAYFATITINNATYDIVSVLAYDENIDLAVLRIDASNLIAANICKNPVQVGETVYALGSSKGYTNTFSQGMITHDDRVVRGVSHVQHDASITNGNSGGPLINVYGEVIGINTWQRIDAQNLNFAVFVDELDNLRDETELTLADFNEFKNTPYEILLDWVHDNYNFYSDSALYFDYYENVAWYSLGYNIDNDYLYIDVLWTFDDGTELYLLINLSGDLSKYYYASYTDGENSNQIYGFIDAEIFTQYTELTYVLYEGNYWTEESLMSYYQSYMVDLIYWFDWATSYYYMGVGIEDLGFSAFDLTAQEVLINHLVENGESDASGDHYEINQEYHYSNYDVTIGVSYAIDTEILSAYMGYWEDDVYIFTFLALDDLMSGRYYAGSYNLKNSNGIGYEQQNHTYGYIDPSTFTSSTVLTYSEYDGLVGYESQVLQIYAYNIQDILNWLNSYFTAESLGITIADLGFVAYQ